MATYYVSTSGSDSNLGLSLVTAFRSIQKAVYTLAPGDTCLVNNGTYTATDGGALQTIGIVARFNTPAQSGNAGALITLKSLNPLGAKIQLPSVADTSNRGFTPSREYWIIDGFEFTGGTNSTGANLSYSAISVSTGATGLIIKNCWIHDIARTVCSDSGFGFAGILIDDVSSLGIVIEDNLLHTIGRRLLGESGCGSIRNQHDHGIYARNTTNLTIQRNVIYDTNRGYPIHFFGGTNTSVAVYNNTLSGRSPSPQTVPDPRPTGHIIIASAWAGTSNIKNNIFHDLSTDAPLTWFSSSGVGTITIDHNFTDSPDTNWFNGVVPPQVVGGAVTNSINNTNPLFVNATTHDYHLTSSSLAINAGTNVGLPFNGGAPDMGAFESNFGTDTTPPAAPTGLQVS